MVLMPGDPLLYVNEHGAFCLVVDGFRQEANGTWRVIAHDPQGGIGGELMTPLASCSERTIVCIDQRRYHPDLDRRSLLPAVKEPAPEVTVSQTKEEVSCG
jgi:hypothetical protein